MEKTLLLQHNKNRDAAFLEKFCERGEYLTDGKDRVVFVCKPVDADEVLTFMHRWDAVLVETLK